MTKKPHPVVVTIMGKEYKIACVPEEHEDLIQSAQQLDLKMRKMRDSGQVIDPDRIAVMSALNMAHELQVLRNQNAMLSQSVNEYLDSISQKIENVLENR